MRPNLKTAQRLVGAGITLLLALFIAPRHAWAQG